MTVGGSDQRLSKVWRNALWLIMWLLLTGALLFTADWEADRQERWRMDAFQGQLTDLTLIAEAISAAQLRELDNSLLLLRAAYADGLTRFAANVRLLRSGSLADRELMVVLVDRDGYLAYTDGLDVKPRLYLGDRTYFRFFADGGKDKLYIDEPSFGRVTKRYTLPLARPIYDRQGGFLGVVAISVKQESLAHFASHLQLSDETTITIVNHSGAVVSRSRDLARVQGTKLSPAMLENMLTGSEGIFSSGAASDITEKIITYRHLHNGETPLIVYAEASPEKVRREARLERSVLMGSAGFTSLVIMILIVVYLKGRKISSELIEHLRSSKRQEYEILTGTSLDGFLIADCAGRILDINDTLGKLLGYNQEELLCLSIPDIEAAESPQQVAAHIRKVMATGSDRFPSRYRRKNGTIIDVEISAQYVKEPGGRFFVFIRDITELKQRKEERETTIELLHLLNSEDDLHETMKSVGNFLHNWSGCEAVGVRLRDGNDFPYFETLGFPSDFVRAENKLCVETIDGQLELDEGGNPILECMCGNILCGRFDPSKPFFTAHGSFWSNCTTDLLASTTEAERQARTRNRCNGEGYESVALIPLRMGHTTFGLIQLNDKRTGRFTTDSIAQIEWMSNSIAICLAQRMAKQELQQKEQQLSRVIETSPVGITKVDVNGVITFANHQAQQILGLTRNCITGMTYNDPLWKITDLAGNPFHEKELPFTRVMETQKPVYYVQHAIIWPDGRRVLLSINAAPIFNESGKLDGIVASISDITEHKRLEAERMDLEERLHRAEKMESLGKLAGGVAHDLNNVLGVLSGYSELLVERLAPDNSLREYAANILKSSEKAAAIIEDLLTLARRGVVVEKVADFNSIVANLLATPEFGNLQTYHPRVDFKTDLAKDLLLIKGSPVHLEKTAMNLVSNAAEAIVGSGEVKIRTENRYLDKSVHGYDQVEEGDYVVLTVSDTGEGISATDLNKIFEPFYTKKSMGRSGTGLGLAIVWGTVKDHKGYIDVQSKEGDGTTFTLYFPVTRAKISNESQQLLLEQYMGQGESVLVVDDVPEQRQVAATLLTHLGFQVATASSGEEALEYLRSNKTDILVLDMIMEPGIDGLETYKRVLAINPHQKAVIVSGFSETDQVKEAQQLGAGTYVKKPYLKEKIGLAVRQELDQGQEGN